MTIELALFARWSVCQKLNRVEFSSVQLRCSLSALRGYYIMSMIVILRAMYAVHSLTDSMDSCWYVRI